MIHAFGDFQWDDELFELRCRGQAVAVPPRVLDAIAYLIKHRARVVSKDELLEILWKGVAVSDASLSQIIMLARRAVGDEGERQAVIKTVRGRGFRFVMPVSEQSSEATEGHALQAAAAAGDASTYLQRPAEGAKLWARFEAAVRGEGSLVLIEGEPGIGKTTFAEQFSSRTRAAGSSVFWGRAWEEGGAPPFWPWTQVLRRMARQFGVEALRDAMGSHETQLLPLLSGSITPEPEARPLEALYVGRAQDRFRVFDGMASLLRRAAAQGRYPLVVVLDDLHAADDASIELLRFLSQDIGDVALLIVATFRDLAVEPQSALGLLLGGPLQNSERVALRGFTAAEVAQLFESVTDAPIAERAAQRIHELSGGNPFLVSELARLYASLGGEASEELAALPSIRVPERVARAVRLRFRALPEPARESLSVASVLGRDVELSQLGGLCERSEAELLEQLAPALELGLVSVNGTVLGFSHAVVRDTLYGDLALSRRVELHRRAGELLEVAGARSDFALYELARHFFLAAAGGTRQKAERYAIEAAQAAERRFAFSAAASLYDQSIRVAEVEPQADDATLFHRLIAAGHASYRAGEVETAVRRYQRAAALARTFDDAESFAWAVFWYALARSASMLLDAPLLALIREALELLPDTDSELRAMLLGHSALAHNSMGDKSARLESTDTAVAMARRGGDDFALTIALSAQLWQTNGVVPPRRELEIADELIAVARRVGRDPLLLNGLHQRIAVRLKLEEFPAARADFAEFAELAQSRGHLSHVYWAAVFRATWAVWSGNFDEALELAGRAARLGARIQDPVAPVLHALQKGQILFEQGRGRELSDADFDPLPRGDVPSTRAMWLVLSLWRGDFEQAYRLYGELCAGDFADVPEDLHRLWVLCVLSNLAAMLGDRPRSERLYELLAPSADLAVVSPATLTYVGPVARSLGLLASSTGAHELAAQHFERAARQCERAGAYPRLAQVEAEAARAMLAAPAADKDRAAAALARSLEIAERLGMAELALSVRSLQ